MAFGQRPQLRRLGTCKCAAWAQHAGCILCIWTRARFGAGHAALRAGGMPVQSARRAGGVAGLKGVSFRSTVRSMSAVFRMWLSHLDNGLNCGGSARASAQHGRSVQDVSFASGRGHGSPLGMPPFAQVECLFRHPSSRRRRRPTPLCSRARRAWAASRCPGLCDGLRVRRLAWFRRRSSCCGWADPALQQKRERERERKRKRERAQVGDARVRKRGREREERRLARGSERSERGREDTRTRKRERERESARKREGEDEKERDRRRA